jgi:hypothetical protein
MLFFQFLRVIQAFHSLRAVRSGDRIPLAAGFSAPVQTSPGSYLASCTMIPSLCARDKAARAWR